jgi:hypothetical protein
MRQLAEEIVTDRRISQLPLWCLGAPKDGSPRHPLYLSDNAQLVPWRRWQA